MEYLCREAMAGSQWHKEETLQMRIIPLLFLLLCVQPVWAQESFKLPPKNNKPVVDYLVNLKVKDTSRRLTESERHDLCRLFVKAYVNSIREHRQDFLLNSGAPVYRLLVTNFPEVAARLREGGSVIFLGSITRFFNSLPDYRKDVEQILRDDINSKHCKQ